MYLTILPEMHIITLYQNVVWNCINLRLFPVDEWNALSTDVRGSDSVRIFKEKIHVSVKNENVLTCRTRPNFFYIWG